MTKPELLRLLDANLNRAREGLRLLEDTARFVHNNQGLAGQFKAMRHQVGAMSQTGLGQQKARNTGGDVGTSQKNKDQLTRSDWNSAVGAAIGRSGESLRVIAEVFKSLKKPKQAALAEKLRYQIYDLQIVLESPRAGFGRHQVYVLLTKDLCQHNVWDTLKILCDAGLGLVQIREKEMEAGQLYRYLKKVLKITNPYQVDVIVNDAVAVAADLEVGGVHLGQGDLPLDAARRVLGPGKVIGQSTHSVAQAAKAKKEGADYVGVGPIWPTDTKVHRQGIGLKEAAKMRKVLEDTPGFLIGSVKRESMPEILANGARRVAVCTGVIAQAKPDQALKSFFKALKGSQIKKASS